MGVGPERDETLEGVSGLKVCLWRKDAGAETVTKIIESFALKDVV